MFTVILTTQRLMVCRKYSVLEQVQVTDKSGTPLSVYPSRTDLQFDLSSVLLQGF